MKRTTPPYLVILTALGPLFLFLCLTGCGGGDATTTSDDAGVSDVDVDLGDLDTMADDTGTGGATTAENAGGAAAPAPGGWGNLTVRFVYGGDPPTQEKLTITQDREYCAKHSPVDESLVVNPENRGIANVIVFLYLSRGDAVPTPHPSYKDTADSIVELDNSGCRFQPHVTLLRTSQTLKIGNQDEVGHNTKADFVSNAAFNEMIPANQSVEKKLTLAERMPSPVGCNIHPWMKGWILVKDNPYMAVSDADGKITIANLPTGEWTFQAWQEAAGYVSNVSIDGASVEWKRGRFPMAINEGENDMGEVVVPAEMFKEGT